MRVPTDRITNQADTVVRLALGATVFGGLLTVVFYSLFNPNPANTFDVFYAAARSALDGRIVYDTRFGLFVYTPITLVYFIPFALLFEFETALLVHRILSVCAAFGYGLVLVRFIDENVSLSRLDRVLIATCMTIGLYPVVVVVLGGIEIFMSVLLGVGFILLERDRDRFGGAAWAVASLFKIFPALWGVYLLRTKRWQAILGAVVTGIGATMIGVLLFGLDAYFRFYESATSNRVRFEMFRGGRSPDNEAVTPLRPLAQIFPDVDPSFWFPVILVVVGALLLYIFLVTPRTGLDDRVSLLLATIIAVEFVMPTSQDLDMYLLYGPLILSLYVERNDAIRIGLAGGMVVYTYNFGRSQLDSVSAFLGPRVNDVVMFVGEPVLRFASMPLYGMLLLFAICIVRARIRSDTTTGSINVSTERG